ncbi:oligoribonuclease [Alcaligenes faecalis subsp. faecalis NCIB 8687]|nr:oligoribonuclease [Alcaligenes faecalis subsp. faecalis NCIB 8687]
MRKRQRLVWLDMEMTGLDPDKERIIEVAVVVTEADLTLVAEGYKSPGYVQAQETILNEFMGIRFTAKMVEKVARKVPTIALSS